MLEFKPDFAWADGAVLSLGEKRHGAKRDLMTTGSDAVLGVVQRRCCFTVEKRGCTWVPGSVSGFPLDHCWLYGWVTMGAVSLTCRPLVKASVPGVLEGPYLVDQE